MHANELLDAAKVKSNITSDYGIAKRLGLPPQSIPAMRSGKRPIPLDVAYKLAIILELDPAQVVAELEAEREKHAGRAEFWRSFLQRAAMVAALACTLALNCLSTCEDAAAKAAFGKRRQYA